jgi:hypothetical protein
MTLMLAYMMEGPRLLFMGGSGSWTFPMDVADDVNKAIIDQGDEKALFTLSMLDYRRQYLKAFRAQGRSKWLHLDICPMSAIERSILYGEIARDDWLPYLGANPIEPDHIDQWLSNVVGLLQTHEDTYHLALLDDINDPYNPLVKSIRRNFWSVKLPANGQCTMFWEEWPLNELGQRQEKNHRLNEDSITRTLFGLYSDIWMYSPESMLMRDKDAVFNYLKSQGEKIPTAYNK